MGFIVTVSLKDESNLLYLPNLLHGQVGGCVFSLDGWVRPSERAISAPNTPPLKKASR